MECRSVTLYSNDRRACRRFYVEFLGLGVVAEGEDQFLALEGSPLCIDAAHGRPVSNGSVLFRTDDLDGVRARSEAMGYGIEREGANSLYFLDRTLGRSRSTGTESVAGLPPRPTQKKGHEAVHLRRPVRRGSGRATTGRSG